MTYIVQFEDPAKKSETVIIIHEIANTLINVCTTIKSRHPELMLSLVKQAR